MTESLKAAARVLAIDPTSRGFGFVVFEGLSHLVDWGVKDVGGQKISNDKCRIHLRRLVDWYRPDVLVIEDIRTKECKRRQRVRAFLHQVVADCAKMKLECRPVRWNDVQMACGAGVGAPRHLIARGVSARFPVLARHIPPPRKPWMPENYWMAMFDAAAMGMTFFLE